MRRLALAILVLAGLFWCIQTFSGTTRYVAQTAGTFTGGTACNGQTAITLATWNATALNPGDITYVCGVITVTANTYGFLFQNSGTSLNPIQLIFDTGAILQSNAFAGANPTSLCNVSTPSNCPAGISVAGFNDIIIDGGTNGIVQNLANGSASVTCVGTGVACAYQQNSLGVYLSGTGLIMRNLTVQHIYDNGGASSGSTDTAGAITADLRIDNASTNFKVCNNTLNHARAGIWADVSGTGTPVTTVGCGINTFPTGPYFLANSTNDHVWQISISDRGTPIVAFNLLQGFTDWYYPNSYHMDGIITAGSAGNVITPIVYDNKFIGDSGGSAVQFTSWVYCTSDGLNDGAGSSCAIYRNLMVGTGISLTTSATAPAISGATGVEAGGGPVGPNLMYFNTLVGGQNCFWNLDHTASVAWTFIGDICVPYGASSRFYSQQESNPLFSLLTIQGNIYHAVNTLSFYPWQWGTGGVPTGNYNSLPGWQAGCVAGSGNGGCDSTASTANPLLDTNFRLQAGSSAIGVVPNETSLASTYPCINQEPPATFGPGTQGCGALLPITGTWDAGAYNSSALGNPANISPFILGKMERQNAYSF